jgi:hypothetical protein
MSDTTPDDVAVKVTAEAFPDFDDEPVTEGRLKFSGEMAVRRPIPHGGKLILVAEVEVADVGHKPGDGGLRRDHATLKAHGYELSGRLGRRILTAAKVAERMAADGSDGRTALEGFLEAEGEAEGLEVTADGSGVVLTPGELSELGLADDATDPVVVILFGGQRLMWPDEFPVGMPRPSAGEMVPAKGDGEADEAQVAELLDPVTGESLAVWTDADEHDRLLALEEEAVAAENAAEEAAVAEQPPLTEGQMANRVPWDGYDGMPAKAVVSQLTTEVFDAEVARHVGIYEGAHKDRDGVTRAAVARERYLRDREERRAAGETVPADEAELAAGAGDLPPLPDDGEEVDG